MTYYNEFIKSLNAEVKNGNHTAALYANLFALLSPADLNSTLEYLHRLSTGRDEYFKEAGKEGWFAIWHKSIRQCDFFSDCYQKRTEAILSDEENREYKYLTHLYVVEKKAKENTEPGRMFTDEYRRYLHLWQRKSREVREDSINGRLDSMLWHLVHVDQKYFLYAAFTQTFRAAEQLQEVANG